MRKLKKFTVVLLILMLTAAQAMSVSAETVSGNNESKSIDVMAKYTGGATTPNVYSVDVTWGKMEFTYSVSGVCEWKPDTHQYDDNTSASWKADGNTITVTNHSNIAVTVSFAYGKASGFDAVDGKFSVQSKMLNAGEEEKVNDADSVTTMLTLSGTLPSSASDFTKVGSVTVSIN